MSAIRFSSYANFERSDKAFTVVHKQALAQAEALVDKTQEYSKEMFGGLALIKRIDCADNGFVLMHVAKDGRIFVRGFSPQEITMHLIYKHNNNTVITEDVTRTFRRVCGDLFLDEKESYLPPDPQDKAPTSQTPDPTTPQPNRAQQAAGAPITDAGRSPKPIDGASIQMHQGQDSGSPDCGGGCNSKGCTIM